MLNLTPDLLFTIIALLLAHVFADFVFQTDDMVKHKDRPGVLFLHIGFVATCSYIALGGGGPKLVALVAISHLVIDAIKTHAIPKPHGDGLPAFTVDQIAHVAAIIGSAYLWPSSFADGVWSAATPTVMPIFVWLIGIITAVLFGGPILGALSKPFADVADPKTGLTDSGAAADNQLAQNAETPPDASRLIGRLERALVFFFVFIDVPMAIGFLIAAKSILRFDTGTHKKLAEYVIIGTLASFGWALAIAYGTELALDVIKTILEPYTA